MNEESWVFVVGLVFGLAAAVFNRRFSLFATAYMYRLHGYRFDPRTYQIIYFLGGIAMAVLCLLALLNISWPWR